MLRLVQEAARRRGGRASARQRSIGLVLTLVLALVGAPAVSAVRNQCSVCPRTCPMHHSEAWPQPGRAAHLKCHAAPAPSTAERHIPLQHGRGPALGRATCGNHGIMPATGLPPVLLPAPQPRLVVATADAAPPSAPTRGGRLADPPDTPPPIAVA